MAPEPAHQTVSLGSCRPLPAPPESSSPCPLISTSNVCCATPRASSPLLADTLHTSPVQVFQKADSPSLHNAGTAVSRLLHYSFPLRSKYLIVYLLSQASEWIQGPTALYYFSHRLIKLSSADVSVLFLCEYAASGVFGCFCGSFTDAFGCRTACITYSFLCSLSCFLTRFSDLRPCYAALLLGRLVGGAAASLLEIAFETLIVEEHRRHGFPEEELITTLARCSFLNGILAIFAALSASFLMEVTYGAAVCFDAAVILSLLCATFTYFFFTPARSTSCGKHCITEAPYQEQRGHSSTGNNNNSNRNTKNHRNTSSNILNSSPLEDNCNSSNASSTAPAWRIRRRSGGCSKSTRGTLQATGNFSTRSKSGSGISSVNSTVTPLACKCLSSETGSKSSSSSSATKRACRSPDKRKTRRRRVNCNRCSTMVACNNRTVRAGSGNKFSATTHVSISADTVSNATTGSNADNSDPREGAGSRSEAVCSCFNSSNIEACNSSTCHGGASSPLQRSSMCVSARSSNCGAAACESENDSTRSTSFVTTPHSNSTSPCGCGVCNSGSSPSKLSSSVSSSTFILTAAYPETRSHSIPLIFNDNSVCNECRITCVSSAKGSNNSARVTSDHVSNISNTFIEKATWPWRLRCWTRLWKKLFCGNSPADVLACTIGDGNAANPPQWQRGSRSVDAAEGLLQSASLHTKQLCPKAQEATSPNRIRGSEHSVDTLEIRADLERSKSTQGGGEGGSVRLNTAAAGAASRRRGSTREVPRGRTNMPSTEVAPTRQLAEASFLQMFSSPLSFGHDFSSKRNDTSVPVCSCAMTPQREASATGTMQAVEDVVVATQKQQQQPHVLSENPRLLSSITNTDSNCGRNNDSTPLYMRQYYTCAAFRQDRFAHSQKEEQEAHAVKVGFTDSKSVQTHETPVLSHQFVQDAKEAWIISNSQQHGGAASLACRRHPCSNQPALHVPEQTNDAASFECRGRQWVRCSDFHIAQHLDEEIDMANRTNGCQKDKHKKTSFKLKDGHEGVEEDKRSEGSSCCVVASGNLCACMREGPSALHKYLCYPSHSETLLLADAECLQPRMREPQNDTRSLRRCSRSRYLQRCKTVGVRMRQLEVNSMCIQGEEEGFACPSTQNTCRRYAKESRLQETPSMQQVEEESGHGCIQTRSKLTISSPEQTRAGLNPLCRLGWAEEHHEKMCIRKNAAYADGVQSIDSITPKSGNVVSPRQEPHAQELDRKKLLSLRGNRLQQREEVTLATEEEREAIVMHIPTPTHDTSARWRQTLSSACPSQSEDDAHMHSGFLSRAHRHPLTSDAEGAYVPGCSTDAHVPASDTAVQQTCDSKNPQMFLKERGERRFNQQRKHRRASCSAQEDACLWRLREIVNEAEFSDAQGRCAAEAEKEDHVRNPPHVATGIPSGSSRSPAVLPHHGDISSIRICTCSISSNSRNSSSNNKTCIVAGETGKSSYHCEHLVYAAGNFGSSVDVQQKACTETAVRRIDHAGITEDAHGEIRPGTDPPCGVCSRPYVREAVCAQVRWLPPAEALLQQAVAAATAVATTEAVEDMKEPSTGRASAAAAAEWVASEDGRQQRKSCPNTVREKGKKKFSQMVKRRRRSRSRGGTSSNSRMRRIKKKETLCEEASVARSSTNATPATATGAAAASAASVSREARTNSTVVDCDGSSIGLDFSFSPPPVLPPYTTSPVGAAGSIVNNNNSPFAASQSSSPAVAPSSSASSYPASAEATTAASDFHTTTAATASALAADDAAIPSALSDACCPAGTNPTPVAASSLPVSDMLLLPLASDAVGLPAIAAVTPICLSPAVCPSRTASPVAAAGFDSPWCSLFHCAAPSEAPVTSLVLPPSLSGILPQEQHKEWEKQKEETLWNELCAGAAAIRKSKSLQICGLVHISFETPLLLFYVHWMPSLGPYPDPGLVFTGFMVCVLTGTHIFLLVRSKLHAFAY